MVRVSREQTNLVSAPEGSKLLEFLIGECFDRCRVEKLRVLALHREIHGKLRDHRLTGPGGCRDKHAPIFFETCARSPLKRVQLKLLSRASCFAARRSCRNPINHAAKYKKMSGMARRNMDTTSADGVANAVKRTMRRIATRHPLMIVSALMTPTKFSSTINTGSTNATPITRMSLRTKST